MNHLKNLGGMREESALAQLSVLSPPLFVFQWDSFGVWEKQGIASMAN